MSTTPHRRGLLRGVIAALFGWGRPRRRRRDFPREAAPLPAFLRWRAVEQGPRGQVRTLCPGRNRVPILLHR